MCHSSGAPFSLGPTRPPPSICARAVTPIGSAGSLALQVGRSATVAVDRQVTHRRLRYSKAEAFRQAAFGVAMLQIGKPGDFPRRSIMARARRSGCTGNASTRTTRGCAVKRRRRWASTMSLRLKRELRSFTNITAVKGEIHDCLSLKLAG
jgi:hypothetical protein